MGPGIGKVTDFANGYTYRENMDRFSSNGARKDMHVALTADRELYELRERGEDGKVKTTASNPFGFLFTSARANAKADARAEVGYVVAEAQGTDGDGRTFTEAMNTFSSSLRDWLGLTREREAYEKRILAQGGHATLTQAFTFKFTTDRAEVFLFFKF